jgi:hypothetical protein
MIALFLALAFALAALQGCAPAPPPPDASVSATGVTLHDDAGLTWARLSAPDGTTLLTRRAPAAVDTLSLRYLWPEAGVYTLETAGAGGSHRLSLPVATPAAAELTVEAPVGQGRQRVQDGDRVPLTVLGEGGAQVAISALAVREGPARITLGGVVTERDPVRAGERLVALGEVRRETPVVIEIADEVTRFTLVPDRVSLDDARERVKVVSVVFPARLDGTTDPTRPAGRVTLPSPWWGQLVRRLGLGFRARDGWTPWAQVGITVENTGQDPVNLVLRHRVLRPDGEPARAFRARLIDESMSSGQDASSALLRVPAGGTATASLPIFVDDRLLDADTAARTTWTRELSVLPIGASEPLHVLEAPLYVSRGGAVVSAGLGLAFLAAIAGGVLLVARGPRWLRTNRTGDLMTIALFSALTFLVAAVGRLLTMGLAMLLGPFASLLTGLADDAFRYALLATLVTLLPRPGTAALAVITTWLLTGVAMGELSPVDLISIGGRVFWLESLLWLSGLTRGSGLKQGGQEEGAFLRWLRLSFAFGVSSVLGGATTMVLAMVLYRLYYADWFIGLMLGGPSFLYVLLACAVAVPFSASLRRVQR